MKHYKRINNVLGWSVFLISCFVYILTAEPTMSFWDCGEYIATAFKLEVGHPPGAPMFQLIGRFFSLFSFGNEAMVARMINTMSGIASAFTILFLFWSITMLAKKIMSRSGEITEGKGWMIMGSGLVGSLAYAFSDSFWFSAAEGEVYAMSSFFTAVVFWAILKWDEVADDRHAVRWLIFIAYMMGLSIGVHLLNLLAIPAITLVYYYRKYPNPDWKGTVLALGISVIILATIMYLIIPFVVKFAGWIELFSVNTLGLPFNIGTLFYFILLIGIIVWGLIVTRRRIKPLLNTILLAFTFILIGYSSFFLLVIRSNADTPIDENNPENAMYLLAYLNREQYGEWPLLKGQYFNAPVIARKAGTPVYSKDEASGRYVITDPRTYHKPVYDPRFETIFPRMWANIEQRYMDEYQKWAEIKGVPAEVQTQGGTETRNVPTFKENLRFFWRYQVVHMYYRYFMWNFAGRQNDIQGMGNKIEGNWKSGIGFLDRWRLGPQEIPQSMHSKADNRYYLLPLLFGIAGIFWSFRRDRRSAFVILLLFFMTGMAIVFYLNQYSPQPRERDYAYAASFYAFAIWIGLAIPGIAGALSRWIRPVWAAAGVTIAALVLVPGIMAQQGWDDHDRSGRYTALAMAKNYLNSCESNAILFTNGDNDTFPLWYAQEVEGIRTDVRVVNLSLLNTEWYIDQMRRKAYDSDPVPFSMTRERYQTGNHDVTYLFEDPALKGMYVDLKDLFSIVNTDEKRFKMDTEQIGFIDYFPTKQFLVTADSASLAATGYIPGNYLGRVDSIFWKIDLPAIEKSQLMILDILATNNWKRPVYFVMTTGSATYLGLDDYLFLEGLTYRLLPVRVINQQGQTGEVHTDAMYDHVINKFDWGNMEDPDVHIDDNNARMIMNLRSMMGRLATALLDEGKADSAHRVLELAMQKMPESAVRFDYFMVPIGDCYIRLGEHEKGIQILEKVLSAKTEELKYIFSFPVTELKPMDIPIQEGLITLNLVSEVAKLYLIKDLEKKAGDELGRYYDLYLKHVYQP